MYSNNAPNWYENLIKPAFAPPTYLFGIVWSIIYPIIFVTYGYTAYLVFKKKASKVLLLPVILNLIFNFLFSPIQFGLKNNLLAAIDITLVLITIIWYMLKIKPVSKKLMWAQIPYLLWVSFATVLQYSITYLNM